MTHILRAFRCRVLACACAVGAAGCNMDVTNPAVIDASTFDPNANGPTLSLSAQTNFFTAFQSVALYGGLIAGELYTGAIRLQTNKLSSRNFVSTDDINPDFFAPLSLAIASNLNAATILQSGAAAASDVNLARADMNAAFALELMAETMCAGVIQGGPQLSDAQLIDSAITRFTAAVSVATAAGSAGANIVNESNIGLARAYLQRGDYAHATQTAALVPAGFVANVLTSANLSTQSTLGNLIYGTTIGGQAIVPRLYRTLADPRVPLDSTQPGHTTAPGLPYIIQTKYTGYAAPLRLASGLEAQFISAEAQLHQSGATAPALALIATERAAGRQPAYSGGTDTLSVITELLNQRAREFWMEGKKLGDLRRNPSVSLAAVLTDPVGAAYYNAGASQFGSAFCTPIPPQETNANPHFSP